MNCEYYFGPRGAAVNDVTYFTDAMLAREVCINRKETHGRKSDDDGDYEEERYEINQHAVEEIMKRAAEFLGIGVAAVAASTRSHFATPKNSAVAPAQPAPAAVTPPAVVGAATAPAVAIGKTEPAASANANAPTLNGTTVGPANAATTVRSSNVVNDNVNVLPQVRVSVPQRLRAIRDALAKKCEICVATPFDGISRPFNAFLDEAEEKFIGEVYKNSPMLKRVCHLEDHLGIGKNTIDLTNSSP